MLQIDFFCKSEYISFRYVKGTVSPDWICLNMISNR
jgi:hypothetical protein